MRIADKTKEHLSYVYIAFRVGIRRLAKMFVEPRSQTDEARRRERILLIVLSGIVTVLICFESVTLFQDLSPHHEEHVSLFIFSLITVLFVILYIAARKGYARRVSILFILLYFSATVYGSIVWGASLPIGLLSYALLITMGSIVISTRFGLVMTASSVCALLLVGYHEASSKIIPNWKQYPVTFHNLLEYSLMLSLSALLSWLSNRELERSLHRAKESERLLSHERNNLERLVEERTMALRAAQLERTAELSRFAEFGKISAGLFHDLLNPLTAVSLSIEHLDIQSKEHDLHHEAKRAIEIAVTATKRIEEYMSNFRGQIRFKEEHREFSVQQEIKIVFGSLYFKAQENRVTLCLESALDYMLYGDPLQFNQVLHNLVSNAIDSYMYEGIIFADTERNVTISLCQKNSEIVCMVSDNGRGIAPETLPYLFRSSFTTKHTGIGIGLAVTKEIVEKHFGGSIEIKSAFGRGTTVTVTIPDSHSH